MPKRIIKTSRSKTDERNALVKSAVKRQRTNSPNRILTPEYDGIMTRAKRRKLEIERSATKKDEVVVDKKMETRMKNFSVVLKKLTKAYLERAEVYVKEAKPKETDRSTKKLHLPSKTDENKPGNAIEKPDFIISEIIWAKIRGHSHWPAKIERI